MLRRVRLKARPEDFVVREAYRFEKTRRGEYYVYLMDKQKLSTFEAVSQVASAHGIPVRNISFCGLKDKQGRTEQIIAVRGQRVEMQTPQLRLKYLGRTGTPLSAKNIRANRFVVTVRDLTLEEAERIPASIEEVRRLGLVNYFDSQRFGSLKHGRGWIAKDLAKGRLEHALRGYLATPSDLDRSEDAKVKRFWQQHFGDWGARCRYKKMREYRPIVEALRRNPKDYAGALMKIERRQRGMILFEYQSYLFNESVRRYLLGRFTRSGLLALKYQAGVLLFPRRVPEAERLDALFEMDFPLVGPDTKIADPEVRKAVEDTLRAERLSFEELAIPKIPEMGFRHELRPLVVQPSKLSVVDPRPDELHPGRVKVTLAFTLPPGAYASLLVRRTLWFATDEAEHFGGPLPEADRSFLPEGLEARVHAAHSRAVHRRNRRPRPIKGITAVEIAERRRRSRRTAGGKAAAPAPRGGTRRRRGRLPPVSAPQAEQRSDTKRRSGHRKSQGHHAAHPTARRKRPRR
ncbi:MAG: tRNA pseudouridine(13) synthase TruD [Deltaproteobacteria bacterium]|nr:MAG: tRNA pseudouridine(13) synthase TruD [Deltaproteobacteria bacterium]